MKNIIGIRNNTIGKEENFNRVLNFAGINYKKVGTQKFNNKKHKGYKILRGSEILGYSDSLENINNLLMIEGYYRDLGLATSEMKLKFIGGLEILLNFRRDFDLTTLKNFSEVEFNKVTRTLTASERIASGRPTKKARKRY